MRIVFAAAPQLCSGVPSEYFQWTGTQRKTKAGKRPICRLPAGAEKWNNLEYYRKARSLASLGMRQSPRGERATLPIRGPSGRQ